MNDTDLDEAAVQGSGRANDISVQGNEHLAGLVHDRVWRKSRRPSIGAGSTGHPGLSELTALDASYESDAPDVLEPVIPCVSVSSGSPSVPRILSGLGRDVLVRAVSMVGSPIPKDCTAA